VNELEEKLAGGFAAWFQREVALSSATKAGEIADRWPGIRL
jgi:hypothetical protein